MVKTFVALAGALVGAANACAQPLGPTHPVIEPDMLEELQQHAFALQRSGQWQTLMEQGARRAAARMREPPPVEGIVPASERRTRWFDPSWVAERDVTLPDGTVLARRGDRVNPLQHVAWRQPWVFIDARNRAEVLFAEREATTGATRVVLVAGDWAALSERLRQPVYFDQYGFLSRRLGIKATPSRVTQDGLRLRIDEIPVRRSDQ
jgi:conjugal transfer pilus assembly protein TraW